MGRLVIQTVDVNDVYIVESTRYVRTRRDGLGLQAARYQRIVQPAQADRYRSCLGIH